MRRFLSLFMMLLLALRGLAGDVMAMESPAAHSPAHIVAAQAAAAATMHMSHNMDHGSEHTHDAHAAHEGHAAMDSAQCSAAEPSSCDSHDGSHCTTCGLCHTAMGQAQIAIFAGPAPASRKAPYGADRFASVAPAAQIKPPISAV